MSDKTMTLKSALEDASNVKVRPGNKLVFTVDVEPQAESIESLTKAEYETSSPLMEAIRKSTGTSAKKAPALAFTENPAPSDNFLGLYKTKRRSLPDEVIKQVRITDHLVAAIIRSRGNTMSLYGHERKDRFDTGIEIEILPEFLKILTPEQFEKVKQRMKRFMKLLMNCGHTEGLENQEHMTFAEFLETQTKNGVSFGRFSTEIIYDRNAEPDAEGNYHFHRFRPTDVATILRAVRKGENVGNSLRISATRALESITGEKINIDIKSLQED